MAPSDPVLNNNYAIYLVQIHEYEKANLHHELSIEYDPSNSAHYYNYALFLKNYYNDLQKAQEIYLKACELNPELRNEKNDKLFSVGGF